MKRVWLLSMTIGIVCIIGGNLTVTSAKAKVNKYSWSSGSDEALLYYTSNSVNKDAYIWNKNFSKKMHNLKNYKYTSWYVTRSFERKGRVYYQLHNYSAKVSGYVWRGFMTPAVAKNLNSFKTDEDYTNYLKTDVSQKLARALLKYFPDANISLDASKKAASKMNDNSINGYTHVVNLGNLSSNVKMGEITTNKTISEYLRYPWPTNANAASGVNGILVKNGYNQGKIKKIFSEDYKLGIYTTGLAASQAGKNGYPWTVRSGGLNTNNSALVLVK